MNDREMLEAAAKAAGMEVVSQGDNFWIVADGVPIKHWNPLTDDGDRYRLARKCRLQIDFHQGTVTGPDYRMLGFWSPGNSDDEALAIVRAVAEIGRKT